MYSKTITSLCIYAFMAALLLLASKALPAQSISTEGYYRVQTSHPIEYIIDGIPVYRKNSWNLLVKDSDGQTPQDWQCTISQNFCYSGVVHDSILIVFQGLSQDLQKEILNLAEGNYHLSLRKNGSKIDQDFDIPHQDDLEAPQRLSVHGLVLEVEYPATRMVSGKIVDEDEEGIPFANVAVLQKEGNKKKEATVIHGTATDFDGLFFLEVPQEAFELEASYQGNKISINYPSGSEDYVDVTIEVPSLVMLECITTCCYVIKIQDLKIDFFPRVEYTNSWIYVYDVFGNQTRAEFLHHQDFLLFEALYEDDYLIEVWKDGNKKASQFIDLNAENNSIEFRELSEIKSDLFQLSWSIHPNPAAERIELKFPVSKEETQTQIWDKQGKQVLERVLPKSTTSAQLDLSELAVGQYIVVLVQEDFQSHRNLQIIR